MSLLMPIQFGVVFLSLLCSFYLSVAFQIPISSSVRPSLKMQVSADKTISQEPLLLRSAKGEKVERVPVWMMRQAGRHMQAYRDLCKKYTTFRERSEIPEVAAEISLQPWRAYQTDGCILFSDILTPLPGMNIQFNILEKEGPKISPMRTKEDVERISSIDPYQSTPFVATALQMLQKELVGTDTALLGFIGLPFTIATYLVEGGSSSDYKHIKFMAYENPAVLHLLLSKLAQNLADYACFQIENGAQVVQLFDSWAGFLSSYDYDVFALPYQRFVVEKIKAKYPKVPLILYINRSGALIEKMVGTGVDIISLDWTVSITEAKSRIKTYQDQTHDNRTIGLQGNLDPMLLFAPEKIIKERTEEILKQGNNQRHVMNLGHGMEPNTSEEKAKYFVDLVKQYRFSS